MPLSPFTRLLCGDVVLQPRWSRLLGFPFPALTVGTDIGGLTLALIPSSATVLDSHMDRGPGAEHSDLQ